MKSISKKRKPPQKQCPKCEASCHARSSKCDCGHIFYKKKRATIEDWTSLVAGDSIKSVKGHGSYWINTETKEKVYMGVYGRLVVRSVRHDGLIAYKIHKGLKSNTSEFVYMGSPRKWKMLDSYHMRPHKLIWDKKRKRR
jgi:hypothetical protein